MLERQAESSQRQERSFQRLMHEAEGREARAVARDERLIERFDRSERRIISALGDVNIGMEQSIERLKDMKDAIQANTDAVLAALDLLRPPPSAA